MINLFMISMLLHDTLKTFGQIATNWFMYMLYYCLVRLESSGSMFRGLAVQVREATESTSFSNDAAFIGAFANPTPGGNWRIWDCAAVSD